MSTLAPNAVTDLLKREPAKLVAATGMFIDALAKRHPQRSIQDVLESHRSGVWGNEAAEGCGYPVLRSTNMRGSKANVAEVAWREVPEKQAAGCALQTGDILVTKSSGSSDLVGKSVLFVQPDDKRTYLFSNFTHRLRPSKDLIEPRYLGWFLRSPQSLGWRYEAQQNAVGLRNLQTEEFLSQLLPMPLLVTQVAVASYLDALEAGQETNAELPAELAEQRRIVARIEGLAAKIEEGSRLQLDLRNLTSSLMTSVYNRVTSDNEGCMGVLSQGMVSAKNGLSRRPSGYEQGPIVLRLADLSSGYVNLSSPRRGTVSSEELDDYQLKAGDLLFIRVNGSREIVGRCIPFQGANEPVCYNDHLIRVRLDANILDWRYVAKVANSPLAREYMESVSITTAGQNTINQEMLRNLPIPIPTRDEQRRIVAELDALQTQVETLKRLQAETAAKLDALLPSILDKAFKGEL